MKTLTKAALATPIALGALIGTAAPANAASEATWDALAECESGGNWSTNTGNGFSGGLQFTPSTWAAFGGNGSPQNASKSEQIAVAENVLAGQGWGAWPACSSSLGLSGGGGGYTPEPAAPKASYNEVSAQQFQSAPSEAPAKADTGETASETLPAETPAPVQTEETVTPEAPVKADASQTVTPQAPAPAPVVTETPAPAVAPTAPAQSYGATHTVIEGDTMNKIAKDYGTTLKALLDLNPQLEDANLIYIGDLINIG